MQWQILDVHAVGMSESAARSDNTACSTYLSKRQLVARRPKIANPADRCRSPRLLLPLVGRRRLYLSRFVRVLVACRVATAAVVGGALAETSYSLNDVLGGISQTLYRIAGLVETPSALAPGVPHDAPATARSDRLSRYPPIRSPALANQQGCQAAADWCRSCSPASARPLCSPWGWLHCAGCR